MQIIPVINAPDQYALQGAVKTLETFLEKGSLVHLDVADGIFTVHKTWNNPALWPELVPSFMPEVHLMVEHPEVWAEPWLAVGARRLIVSVETINTDSLDLIIGMCKKSGAEVMLSSNPETPIQKVMPYVEHISFFQVLAVNPGLAGQKFLPLTLEKVIWLRQHKKDAILEVDGGINAETARLAKEAGADIVVSSSYIFVSPDPKKAYEELERI